MFWPSYHLCLAKTSLDFDETLSNAAQFLHTLAGACSLPNQTAADDERAVTEEWALRDDQSATGFPFAHVIGWPTECRQRHFGARARTPTSNGQTRAR
jgi:hypothetical protein